MTADRWPEIDRLCAAALERDPAQRSAFLDEACAGDPELRREVDSLLSAESDGDAVFAVPAVEAAAWACGAGELLVKGTRLGPYEIDSLIASGGMGEVYRALDTRLRRDVAVKVLPQEFAADPERRHRFQLEAEAVAALNHPNILAIHDIGLSPAMHATRPGVGSVAAGPHVYYLVTELLNGETLTQRVTRGALPIDEALDIALPLALALAAAHDKHIVHRDIKPSNVFLTSDGQVKLLDFGIAKIVTRTVDKEASPTTDTNRAGATSAGMGTAGYMSPEQARGLPTDSRSDIFSFGAVLYEMLTGRRAFPGETSESIIAAIETTEPPPISDAQPQVPAALERLVRKCLAKAPAERWQSARDVADQLRGLRESVGPPAAAEQLVDQSAAATSGAAVRFTRMLKPRWLAAGAGLLLCAGVGLFAWHPWRPAVPVSTTSGRPTIAVTYVDNQSGQAGLDRVLVNLLTTNLDRLGGLEVVSTQRMYDVLKQLGKSDATAIDRATATAVATRAGASSMLSLAVVKLGEQVRITAELVRIDNGSIIATFQQNGQRIDDVFAMVDGLTEDIAARFGLSRRTPGLSLKVGDATTTSLAAYDHYQKGFDFILRTNYAAATKELEQSVAIDPTFASAWAALAGSRMGLGNWMFGDRDPSRQALAQAVRYVDRLSERERLRVRIMQAIIDDRPGSTKEELRLAEELVAKYPDDPRGNMSVIDTLRLMGDLPRARAAAERYLEISPTAADAYEELATIQLWQGDYAAATSTIRKYVALLPEVSSALDSAWVIAVGAGSFDEARAWADRYREGWPKRYFGWRLRGWTALLRDDPEAARREFLSATGTTPGEAVSQATDVGHTFLAEGRYREAETAFRKARARLEALRKGAAPGAVTGLAGLRDAHFTIGQALVLQGRTADAIREFRAGEAVSARRTPGRPDPWGVVSRYLIGTALIRRGDLSGALNMADDTRDLIKRNAWPAGRASWADFLVAEVALARADLQTLQNVIGRPTPAQLSGSPSYARLAAATAALSGDTAVSAAIYRRLATDFYMSRGDNSLPFVFFHEHSRLGYHLGRLYEQEKNIPKAREEYARFLKLMAKADPGNPDVEDAKKRLAALGSSKP